MRRPTSARSRSLRRRMSLPEVLLWSALKGREPVFRRQIPFGSFVVDFYCPAATLAIEVDGVHHDLTGEVDYRRDEVLGASGITVRRIAAADVLHDPEAIAAFCLGLARELIKSRNEPY